MVKQALNTLVLGFCLVCLISFSAVEAQGTLVECGSIVENEFTANAQFHDYSINLSPLDRVTITGSPLGSTLSFNLSLYDPVGGLLDETDRGNVAPSPRLESAALSSGGTFSITAANTRYQFNTTFEERRLGTPSSWQGGIGVYTLYIGCTLRDETVIEPGDTMTASQSSPSTPVEPTFSGTGFPGLPSVDFMQGVTIPFTQGAPNTGSVSAGFEGVFGFTLDVNAGESYTFDFSKISGNLNLGIAILSPDNQIVFYGGMITSSRLSTDVLFPAAGQYTIGVFRVDLLPPVAPENTAFQVTAVLQ